MALTEKFKNFTRKAQFPKFQFPQLPKLIKSGKKHHKTL